MTLGQLTRQIIRVNLDVDLKLLGNSVLDVFVQLAVILQEGDLVWLSLLILARCGLLHEHKDLINTGTVLLHFREIMLQHGCFDTFSGFKSLDYTCILVSNITLNHLFDGFNLLKTMV